MIAKQEARGNPVRRALQTYIVSLVALWWMALLIVVVQSAAFHRAYPYNTLFFIPEARFTDFTIFYDRFQLFLDRDSFFSACLTSFPFTYPAPLLLCFLAMWKIGSSPLGIYILLITAFAGLTAVTAVCLLPARSSVKRLAVILVSTAALGTYPLFFLVDRANLEGFVWMAGSVGLFCFVRRHYTAAAMFFALAASMKLFPGVLLLLLLAKRRYRDAALGMAAIVACTFGSLWVTGPSIDRAAKGIAMGMDFFRRTQIMAFRPSEVGFDHSLFSCLKQVLFRFLHDADRLNAVLPGVYVPYAALAALAFTALYVLRLRILPVLNQVLALSALSVTLPFISYEYTLVNLVAPFIILTMFLAGDVSSGRVPLTRRQILAVLLPYAILFTPMSFLLMHGFGFGGQVKTFALLWVIGTASWIRLPSSLFGELSDRLVMEFRLEIMQPVAAPMRQLA